jgi:hypothetical protein
LNPPSKKMCPIVRICGLKSSLIVLLRTTAVVGSMCFFCLSQAEQAKQSLPVTYLGALSGSSSKANAVSADGSVIVGWGDVAGVAARDAIRCVL